MASAPSFDLIVIGGGAAGFFGAINAAQLNPTLKILILEKSPKLLSKVKVSGGGRCNVTHHCFEPTPLSKHYPRGQKELKNIFRTFDAKSTVAWFADLGVDLKTEDDGRMFPVTNDSQTIIDCFLSEAHRHRIQIELSCGVERVEKNGDHFLVYTSHQIFQSKKVLVAIGGHPQKSSYAWIEKLNHTITPLIPSLFTFNDTEKKFTDLMGVSVGDAEVKIAGTKLSERGPVLITHWGLSGPAVIKLSAWAAEYLHQKNYTFTALVNWTGTISEDELRSQFQKHKAERGKQKIISNPFFGLSQRLWEKLVLLAEISEIKIWGEISSKEMNRLIEFLIRCPFKIKGKTTFKEEFVTCGGVPLTEIDLNSMQSKKVQGLFFAGEVLNLDGETGGFNFQAAWSTAYLAAKSINSNP
ncbi:MAG: NAD(P)/FAD-dependent oxidoreductase [Bacteroidetes bacterium]|nr:NAD(P)/FAD-dependent oxidoreductase [Bacteroidota bacterium]